MKAKVTLSVDEDLLREARGYLAENNQTISGTLEAALSDLAASSLFEKMAERLGEVEYVSHEEVQRSRPKGMDAARAVRDARAKALSRQLRPRQAIRRGAGLGDDGRRLHRGGKRGGCTRRRPGAAPTPTPSRATLQAWEAS